jgi:hypothetical protein
MIKKRNIDQDTRLADFGEVLTYDITGGAADDFLLAEQNPYTDDVIIERVILEITTAGGTATAVLDMDVASSATGTGDSIFDGVDANAAAISDSLNSTDNGTNGIGKAIVWNGAGGTNDYLNIQQLVEAASSLVGKVYVHIIKR